MWQAEPGPRPGISRGSQLRVDRSKPAVFFAACEMDHPKSGSWFDDQPDRTDDVQPGVGT
jgi:hypothetical protein